jgi:hypothetical protein
MAQRIIVTGLAVAALLGASCGGSDDNSAEPQTQTRAPTQTTTPTQTAEAAPSGPLECLEQAGLSDPEQRDADLWRGGSVRITRMPSTAQAQRGVRDAVDVWAEAAGRYAVFGVFKSASTASRESQADVKAVAACLRAGE